MTTTRQNKVARLLQRDISDILQKESRSLFRGALLTVTTVRIAPDLSFAKVYVSIFAPNQDDKQELFEKLQKNTVRIRTILAQKVAKQLRIVPELAFFLDDSLDYESRIEELLK
ncbi:MAG: 30S ribosome-binding factor RbfA [Bacteroidales bacterium]|jgi:ribosome-binding factor A|nr:30S ribosome-binding factor RbfA [Bacteroidales bacterium]NLK81088.1 30S ribosome-binding factor RbfA [Bacteroidales bacterium]HPY82539.1 30S ribosome-binding factor RbfA [Bacteroidales bacterium]